MKIFDVLDLTQPGVVLGNHGIWLPDRKIKVPFQWGGRITKRTRQEDTWPRETIADEIAILRALAEQKMAPPVGDLVFFRNVISTYPGAWHCDPCGAFGFEIEDANALPKGAFDIDAMKAMSIAGSTGAWGDVAKRENVVNGYLVDVRRSGFDLLRWEGDWDRILTVREEMRSFDALDLSLIHRDCQFPEGERALAYQDFWFRNTLQKGQRRVSERAVKLGFIPKPEETVLDIGTQSGSFLQYAYYTGNRNHLIGVDVNRKYIDRARDLARSCGQNICYRKIDAIRERDEFLAWIRRYFNHPDHLLLLSMEKHLGEGPMFQLIDEIGAKHTYIETNAVAEDNGEGPEPEGAMKLWDEVKARKGEFVGSSRDRNLRRLYRISK